MQPLKNLTPVQIVILSYFLSILIFSLLFRLPITHQPGVDLTYFDALFTATSALSVTGLTVVPIGETFNLLGVFLFLVAFQLGGIGIMTLGTFLWLATGQRIGLNQRYMIMIDQNRSELSGMVRLIKDILLLSMIIQALGAMVFTLFFYFQFHSWKEALLHGIFQASSAFTNAGFDLFGTSLIHFSDNYMLQLIYLWLMITGAIGFPVLIEVKEWLSSPNRRLFRFSLFTKITSATYFILLFGGLILIWIFERGYSYAEKSVVESFFYSLFHSVSARSTGFTTIDITKFGVPSQLLLSFLMFIGASPSSVGGGIRTTTLAVILLAIFSFARGREHIRIFRRELLDRDVHKAMTVFAYSVLLVASATLLITYLQPNLPLITIFFEVCSAFGTSGLSLGITSNLSSIGKLIIIFLMFLGRVGIMSYLFLLWKESRPEPYRYPYEKVIIG